MNSSSKLSSADPSLVLKYGVSIRSQAIDQIAYHDRFNHLGLTQTAKKLSDQEVCLMADIIAHPLTEDGFGYFGGLFEKIYAAASRPSRQERLTALKALRRRVFIGQPVLDVRMIVLSFGSFPLETSLFDEKGRISRRNIWNYDDDLGVVTLSENGKLKEVPLSDVYGAMPVHEAERLGFDMPLGWTHYDDRDFASTPIRREAHSSGGQVTVASWMEEDSNCCFKREVSRHRALQKAGFSYDPVSGTMTIPDIDVINGNSRIRLELVLSRAAVPKLIFLRILESGKYPVGAGIVIRFHDYTAHLLGYLSLPDRVFDVFRGRLRFWLRIVDDPVLEKNEMVMKLADYELANLAMIWDAQTFGLRTAVHLGDRQGITFFLGSLSQETGEALADRIVRSVLGGGTCIIFPGRLGMKRAFPITN